MNESELSIVGAILFDGKEAFNRIESLKLSQEHFASPGLATIYQWAVERIGEGKPVDEITASRETGVAKSIIIDALDHHVSMEAVKHHAEQLRNEHTKRELAVIAKKVIASVLESGEDIETIRSRAEMDIAGLALGAAVRRKDIASALAEQIDLWERAHNTRGPIGVRTGIDVIDTYFGGILSGAMYVLSGSPGSCKTTLARNVMENLAFDGKKVAMLSLEQTTSQIMGAVAARIAKQNVFILNCGSKNGDIEAIKKAKEYVSTLPLDIDDRPHTLTEMMSWGRRKVAWGAELLVIDYLQRIAPDQSMSRMSEEQRLSKISTAIADLAKETGCPVMVIAALNRQGQLRGSGMIDYDAYCHLRMDKGEGWAADNLMYTAAFEKQRFGPPSGIHTMYLKPNGGYLLSEEEVMMADDFDNIPEDE